MSPTGAAISKIPPIEISARSLPLRGLSVVPARLRTLYHLIPRIALFRCWYGDYHHFMKVKMIRWTLGAANAALLTFLIVAMIGSFGRL